MKLKFKTLLNKFRSKKLRAMQESQNAIVEHHDDDDDKEVPDAERREGDTTGDAEPTRTGCGCMRTLRRLLGLRCNSKQKKEDWVKMRQDFQALAQCVKDNNDTIRALIESAKEDKATIRSLTECVEENTATIKLLLEQLASTVEHGQKSISSGAAPRSTSESSIPGALTEGESSMGCKCPYSSPSSTMAVKGSTTVVSFCSSQSLL